MDPNASVPRSAASIVANAVELFIGFRSWEPLGLVDARTPCIFVLQQSKIIGQTVVSRATLFEEPQLVQHARQMSGRGSRLDRYQSVMFRLRLAPSEGQTVASLMAQHKRWFNGGEKAAPFFNHPQVVKALDLGGANPASSGQGNASSSTQNQGTLTADFVDAFWGGLEQKAAQSVPAADGVCGMVHCSNEVNHFQCFQCRRRICSSCGNTGVAAARAPHR